jgi:hypothetical protein
MPTVSEIAQMRGFQGAGSVRTADMAPVNDMEVIDNGNAADPNANVSTSIDCYVAGTYVTGSGKRMEVMQRYTIFVKYSNATQLQTMQQVRNRIAQDFSRRYGQFLVSTVHVPQLRDVAPHASSTGVQSPESVDAFYGGRDAWAMRIMRATFEIGTEHVKKELNTRAVERKYFGGQIWKMSRGVGKDALPGSQQKDGAS